MPIAILCVCHWPSLNTNRSSTIDGVISNYIAFIDVRDGKTIKTKLTSKLPIHCYVYGNFVCAHFVRSFITSFDHHHQQKHHASCIRCIRRLRTISACHTQNIFIIDYLTINRHHHLIIKCVW